LPAAREPTTHPTTSSSKKLSTALGAALVYFLASSAQRWPEMWPKWRYGDSPDSAWGLAGSLRDSYSLRRRPRKWSRVTAAARSPSVTFVDVVDEAVDDAGAAQKAFQAGMPDVTVFGVSHLTNSFEAAEHILRTKPRSVVVETALCKEHAAERGTAFNFAQIFAAIHVGGQTDADESLKFITRVAHQLRLEAHPLETSPFWENMKTQLPAEPLVYAAAFAVDARLVFGDRPKETTYRRLVSCPTLAELDQTFGNQSARNYRLLLPDGHPEVGAATP